MSTKPARGPGDAEPDSEVRPRLPATPGRFGAGHRPALRCAPREARGTRQGRWLVMGPGGPRLGGIRLRELEYRDGTSHAGNDPLPVKVTVTAAPPRGAGSRLSGGLEAGLASADQPGSYYSSMPL
jgi:hypothetical protein